MARSKDSTAARVRQFALALPGAREDFPWGERVAKVNKKVFAFLGKADAKDGSLGFAVKLPQSWKTVLDEPYAEPTGYGLGKSRWVTFHFAGTPAPPLATILSWIEESYRAVAPKKLVMVLDGMQGRNAPAGARTTRATRRKRSPHAGA